MTVINVTIKQLKSLAKAIGTHSTICIRGRHGIGKSESVYQIAEETFCELYKDPEYCASMVEALRSEPSVARRLKSNNGVWTYEMGMPVIERRLSQLTEGDLLGIPRKEANGTVFHISKWLQLACKFPVVLFLDERNRALPAVKQSIFQLMDSRAFSGYRLHDESRLFIAENVGGAYDVNSQDPAENSRPAIVELRPSVEEWLEYAEKVHVKEEIISFIKEDHKRLEHPGPYDEMKKYQDRRAWFNLDRVLKSNPDISPTNNLFYRIAASYLGTETASLFQNYCKNYNKKMVADQLLSDFEYYWPLVKKKLGDPVPAEHILTLSDEIHSLCASTTSNDFTNKYLRGLMLFVTNISSEYAVSLYNKINNPNLKAFESYVNDMNTVISVLITTSFPDAKKKQMVNEIMKKYKP